MKINYLKIRKAREETGLTAKEAAPLAGYKEHSNISQIEKGPTGKSLGYNIPIRKLEALAAAYNTDLSAFFDFDGTEPITQTSEVDETKEVLTIMNRALKGQDKEISELKKDVADLKADCTEIKKMLRELSENPPVAGRAVN